MGILFCKGRRETDRGGWEWGREQKRRRLGEVTYSLWRKIGESQ